MLVPRIVREMRVELLYFGRSVQSYPTLVTLIWPGYLADVLFECHALCE
jgi:hypothetical protein